MSPFQDIVEFHYLKIHPIAHFKDSKILGIKFDWICLRIISPKNSLSHSIFDSGCLVASYSGEDTIFVVQYLKKNYE